MKSIGILSFLILVFILSSCGGNEPERDKKKDASKGISLSSGDAMFPYFKRVPGLSALKRYTYGYMNINGKRVTDNRFRNAHTFTHRLGCVSIHRDDRIWYGFVNTSGEFEIDPTYTSARPLHEERAAVCKDTNLWLVIDTKGKELTQAKYSLLSDYHRCAPSKDHRTQRSRAILTESRLNGRGKTPVHAPPRPPPRPPPPPPHRPARVPA